MSSTNNVPNFMEHPLVVWVQTFNPDPVTYTELCEGAYLNDVMQNIDPRAVSDMIIGNPDDLKERLQNWDTLFKNIRAYYKDVLQQYIVMKLPSITTICKDPETESAHRELCKMLLLLLGCAIQCEQKEAFVENIRKLGTDTQHAIMEYIQEITDKSKNVFEVEMMSEDLDDVSRNLHHHLKLLIDERDGYVEEIKELSSNLEDLYQSQQQTESQRLSLSSLSLGPTGPSQGNSPEKTHLALELAETKARVRKLRQELEEKMELFVELQEELEEQKSMSEKLRKENMELVHDARAARAYRDELDIMKEKAARVEKYETEITKYKEKLNELDFFKARVEELREDNAILVETKTLLEDQLSTSHKRVETVVDLESEMLKLRTQLEQMATNRDKDRQRIQDLEEMNARLDFEKKSVFNESANLEDELMRARQQLQHGLSNSLSEQMSESHSAKILRLELENQRLAKRLEEVQVNQAIEGATKTLELEQENQRLTRRVEKLQAETESSKLVSSLQQVKTELEQAVKISANQMLELQEENEELNCEVTSLRKSLDSLKSEKAKKDQLEVNMLELDTENQKLQRHLEGSARKLESLQQENKELEVQIEELQRNVETLRIATRHVDELEQEIQEQEAEMTNVGKEKVQIEKENRRLKHTLELKEAALEELNGQMAALSHDNKNLRKQAERTTDTSTRIQELEKENLEMMQKTSMDKKTLMTLREELASEKIRTQQLSNELDQLTHELNRVGLDRHKLLAAEHSQDESKYQALENMMQETFRKSMELKEEKIHALESRLEESKSRNFLIQEELRAVKRDYAALEQRREEEGMLSSTSDSSVKSIPNATKEILELKDHMITVERNNATFEVENRNLRHQAATAQEKLNKLESELSNIRHQMASLVGQKEAMESQLAKTQVENITLTSQNATLVSQNSSLQDVQSQLEREQLRMVSTQEELQAAHDTLMTDHEALQRLHDQLTGEYERLLSEHGSLKANYKAMRMELKEAQDHSVELSRDKEVLSRLKSSVEQDRENLKSESASFNQVQRELSDAREEVVRLRHARDTVQTQYGDLQAEHKAVKTEYNQLKLTHTQLLGSYNNARDQLGALDVEVSKLRAKCEGVCQMNDKLEEENRSLMMQLQAVLNQNSDLLTQSLENKDHFHEEARAYMEKMNELRRQKEKLEEKIMEQYKRYDPVKKKSRGFNFLAKAKARMTRSSRNKERSYLGVGESPENSSVGSGDSPGDSNTLSKRQLRQRHNSSGDLLEMDSPKLSKQNKSLTQSTTALNLLKGEQKSPSKFKLRVRKTTICIFPEFMRSKVKREPAEHSDSEVSAESRH